mmetsp:Transcript_84583/g.237870  ORF Transcript_84583/g.237870 Transcript_84583/m.237870 type:complete len:206 (+) Transcript_84583:853-1470(+)
MVGCEVLQGRHPVAHLWQPCLRQHVPSSLAFPSLETHAARLHVRSQGEELPGVAERQAVRIEGSRAALRHGHELLHVAELGAPNASGLRLMGIAVVPNPQLVLTGVSLRRQPVALAQRPQRRLWVAQFPRLSMQLGELKAEATVKSWRLQERLEVWRHREGGIASAAHAAYLPTPPEPRKACGPHGEHAALAHAGLAIARSCLSS